MNDKKALRERLQQVAERAAGARNTAIDLNTAGSQRLSGGESHLDESADEAADGINSGRLRRRVADVSRRTLGLTVPRGREIGAAHCVAGPGDSLRAHRQSYQYGVRQRIVERQGFDAPSVVRISGPDRQLVDVVIQSGVATTMSSRQSFLQPVEGGRSYRFGNSIEI